MIKKTSIFVFQSVLTLGFLILVAGCGHDYEQSKMTPPDLGVIGKKITDAKKVAVVIHEKGTAPKSDESEELLQDLDDALAAKEKADKQVVDQTGELNKAHDRLNYLEPKYSKAVGKLWFWRLLVIGETALFAGFFVLRQYFPFLKLI